jgi:hypothetical protein
MDPRTVEIRLLGRFIMTQGGAEVPPGEFGGRLVRTLIRLLVTHRARFVSKEALGGGFLVECRRQLDMGVGLFVQFSIFTTGLCCKP